MIKKRAHENRRGASEGPKERQGGLVNRYNQGILYTCMKLKKTKNIYFKRVCNK